MALKRFISNTVPTLSPCFAVVTGDLVDAKTQSRTASQQYDDEWAQYRDLADQARASVRTAPGRAGACGTIDEDLAATVPSWFEMRGNHDAFDVPAVSADDRFSSVVSAGLSDAEHRNAAGYSYAFTHRNAFGHYKFVYVDACPRPGLHRPLNFFGEITTKAMDFLQYELQQSHLSDVNQTLVMAHYPLSIISARQTSDGHSYSQVATEYPFLAHLSGHLHTLMGLAPWAYSRRAEGHYELEIGDWTGNRRYRLIAFDHDLMSFVDAELDQWPVILLTNPKPANYLSSTEPLSRIRQSTHIRMLVFSQVEITSVRVSIDIANQQTEAKRVRKGHPLFVLKWNPSDLSPGLHIITITATDGRGNKRSVQHSFSVDGTLAPLWSLSSVLLYLNVADLMQTVYWLVHLGSLAVLLVARVYAGTAHFAAWRDNVLSTLMAQDVYSTMMRKQKLAQCDCGHEHEHQHGAKHAIGKKKSKRSDVAHNVVDDDHFPVSLPTNDMASSMDRHSPSWLTWIWTRLQTLWWAFCESTLDSALYLPMVFFGIVVLFGPWLFGELMTGRYGMVFAWGILVEGEYIHTADTVLYALPRLLLCYVPLMLLMALRSFTVHRRQMQRQASATATTDAQCVHLHVRWMPVSVCVLVLSGWQLWTLWDIVAAYGWAALVSPGSGGLTVMAAVVLARVYSSARS
eukprot:TRINITY_DN2441_c0_g1_i1.p1 TRINITY_DN2441_c0_g1~~TRINITY_DN2441_c0_g1_i1.p1  ORF type:complete len:762 (-),score=130.38 TRINITY_DN2441_c0_g1_i1:269-2323(-)